MSTLLDEYKELIGVRLNMVVSSDGAFTDANGSSRGISNDLDRKLIGHLRGFSDVVVTGGNTARIEKYRVPAHATLAVISKTFDLEGDRFIRLDNPNSAISRLQSKGFKRVLLETGPSLSRFFLESNLVDEFCLTVPNGSLNDAMRVISNFNSSLALAKAQEIEGTLFTIWRRGND